MRDEKLAAWRDSGSEVRIAVQKWAYKERIADQFIEHPRSVWLLWNYVRNVGIRSVVRKLRSRLAEDARNNKVFGIGIGIVAEAPDQSDLDRGALVVFLACNHSGTAASICVHQEFVCPLQSVRERRTVSSKATDVNAAVDLLKPYLGWSPYSGRPVDVETLRTALAGIAEVIGPTVGIHDPYGAEIVPTASRGERNVVPIGTTKPSAVLFGLGNYAKTAILPNIRPYVSLQRVHEIDPDQLAYFGRRTRVSIDTSPYPRLGLQFDSWFIAGFHHTHADLGVAALEQGAYAVIEKPLATTRDQYERFVTALTGNEKPRFFLCFHKRYSELHALAARDIDLRDGAAVDMHCVVYEIPLPKHHWYNWPNSGSRLMSNGCHWIDYFMFVNSYARVVDYHVWQSRHTDVAVHVRLENGAYLVMSLTDTGSQRLGVRDHIELRKDGITIKIVDASLYEAENRIRVLRKRRVNPGDAYARMYRHIAKSIAAGSAGDSEESLRSSELALLLEEAK